MGLIENRYSSGKNEEMREGLRGFKNDENLFRYVKLSSNIKTIVVQLFIGKITQKSNFSNL